MPLTSLIDKFKRVARNPTLLTNRIKLEWVKKFPTCRFLGTPLPAIVYMAPTMRCNLQCRICGLSENLNRADRIPEGTDFSREMSWEEWRPFLDQLGSFKPKVLVSGGEPLLSENTIPIVERLSHKYHMHVGVGTNGLLLEHCAADLFKAGVAHLYISIDGIGDVYEAIRGKGRFAQLQRSLAEVQRLRHDYASAAPGINAIIVMTPGNLKSLRETVDHLTQFGIRRFSFQHFFHFDSDDLARLSVCAKDPRQNPRWTWGEQIDINMFRIADIEEALEDLKEIAEVRADLCIEIRPDLCAANLQNYYVSRPMPAVAGFRCPLFNLGTYIYPDGSVFPAHFCYFSPVGNIRTEPFRKIWYGNAYKHIRRAVAREGWLPACGYCMIPYGACI